VNVPNYVLVGGPPHDWMDYLPYDKATGEEVMDVTEINVKQGWLIKAQRDSEGMIQADLKKGEIIKVVVFGDFEIRRNPMLPLPLEGP